MSTKINTRGRKREARRWWDELMKPMSRKINTRGRKREARRWCDELTKRCAKIFPLDDGVRVWVAELGRLKARDPALAEAVNEVCDDDMRRNAAMTYEQWHARFIRRCERQRRERRGLAAGSAPK